MRIDPGKTALIVVDMQNDFCHPQGYYAGAGRNIEALTQAIEPVADLVRRFRVANGTVVFTRLVHDEVHGAMEERHGLRPKNWTATGDRLRPDSWGAAIVEVLRPKPGDLVVNKAGYSAFDATDLDHRLRERGITTLVLCGVVTYACVLSTGFSAFDKGFDVILATEAAGSWDSDLARASERIVDLLLGHSVSMADLELGQPAAQSA